MGYLHALITLLSAVVFFLLGLPAGLVILITGLFSKAAAERMSYAFVRFGLRLVSAVSGSRVTVQGWENIPKDRPVLFVANHRSIFDVILFFPKLPGRTVVIAKKELSKIAPLRFWMKRIHTIFLDRTDIKAGVQMVQDSVNYLKNGYNVLIFPEGTRSKKEGEFLPFHGGSFKIAIRSGALVVPVTIIGTGDIFEDHFPKLKAKKVTVIISPPIETQGMPIAERKTLPERCRDLMMQNYTGGRA